MKIVMVALTSSDEEGGRDEERAKERQPLIALPLQVTSESRRQERRKCVAMIITLRKHAPSAPFFKCDKRPLHPTCTPHSDGDTEKV